MPPKKKSAKAAAPAATPAAAATTGPASGLPSSHDLKATWSYVQEGVELIMTRLREGMSYTRYMELYTAVYNYCVSSRMTTSGSGHEPLGMTSGGRSGANLMGADLYRSLTNYFSEHLKTVRDRAVADGLADDELLRYYTDEWKRYTVGASYVNRLFTYLNRHWIKREKDEGRKNIYPVYTLSLVSWRDHFFRHCQAELTSAILKVIERHRNGETVDNALLEKLVESLVALGIDEADINRQNLEVYKEAFERPFIAATELYYRTESEAYIADNSVNDYMKKAEQRLKEEEQRVDMYLHPSSRKILISTCETVLVKNHSEIMQEAFQSLLDEEKEDDLNRMYNLLSRIPDGLNPLRDRFETHVKKAGLAAIEVIIGASDKGTDVDPKAYVDALLDVHGKNSETVAKAFKTEAGFVASLDKACREFVNRNKATGTNSSKSPQLLSQYVDGLLRKTNKAAGEEDDMEQSLNRTMTLFKFIEDKDVFQKFYSKSLAQRLIHSASASDDAEASMISKLKDACGFEYTSKLTRMFSDISTCKDLNAEFKAKVDQSEVKDELVDFHVFVLGTAHWPLKEPTTELAMPTELVKTHERFGLHYNSKHSGRKLTWLWHLSRNELRATYTKPLKLTFMTSTYQAAVLLQFNTGGDHISYEDLQSGTKLNDETLKGVLGLLTKQRVLTESKGDDGKPAYELNLDFKSKKVRVNLNAKIKAEQKSETAEVMKTVDEDRKLLIQAVIVRIMKSRKTLKNQALIQETVQQLSARFQPKVADIKKAIDHLLDKEYIQRVDGSRDVFEYLA